jgi:hypothetical protein
MVAEADKTGATQGSGGRVIRVRPEVPSIAEQQMVARKRARTEIPTVQRDFAEVWGEEIPKPVKRRA